MEKQTQIPFDVQLVPPVSEESVEQDIKNIEKMQSQLNEMKAKLEKQKVRAFLHKTVDVTCDAGNKVGEKSKVVVTKGAEKSKDAFYYIGVGIEYTGKGIAFTHKVVDFTVAVLNKVSGWIYKVTGKKA